ncbi:MAG TPA: fused response regulator/phosphatase [Verrucomicrobiae bacterium]
MNPKPTSLLVVDDDPVFTLFLRQLVLSLGKDIPCAIESAPSAEAALALIPRHRFDLALVDYHLPGLSGLELLVQIRRLPPEQQPAVVMLTGSGNESVAVEAMKRGAKDYLKKSDLDEASLMRALQSALTQKRLSDRLAVYDTQIRADMLMAAKLQESLLPLRYPTFPSTAAPENSALRFCHRYFWTAQLGGDFFTVMRLSDTQAGVLICDVMGHGVRSALITAMLRAMIGDLELHALNPSQFLGEMNRKLAAILKRLEEPLYATAFYLVADLAAGEMRYAKAGHPAPLHLRSDTGTVEPLPFPGHAGTALGLFEKADFLTCQRAMLPGDRILLFTDGLYEAANANDEDFGDARLREAVRQRANCALPALLDGVLADVRTFAAGNDFADDVCLLGMEIARTGRSG